MSDFKGRHFEGEVVLWAVRWYCRYGVSYRDLEQMMGERGVSVDHSTIYLGKALDSLKDWEQPRAINTDKAPTYAAALAELKKEC
jgi:transposase-like protein